MSSVADLEGPRSLKGYGSSRAIRNRSRGGITAPCHPQWPDQLGVHFEYGSGWHAYSLWMNHVETSYSPRQEESLFEIELQVLKILHFDGWERFSSGLLVCLFDLCYRLAGRSRLFAHNRLIDWGGSRCPLLPDSLIWSGRSHQKCLRCQTSLSFRQNMCVFIHGRNEGRIDRRHHIRSRSRLWC